MYSAVSLCLYFKQNSALPNTKYNAVNLVFHRNQWRRGSPVNSVSGSALSPTGGSWGPSATRQSHSLIPQYPSSDFINSSSWRRRHSQCWPSAHASCEQNYSRFNCESKLRSCSQAIPKPLCQNLLSCWRNLTVIWRTSTSG